MDDRDEPLTYYDRDLTEPSWESEPAGFLVPLDVFGFLAPVWMVLAAVLVARPMVASFGGWNSSIRWDIAIGFYGLIFAVWLMIPWGVSYLLWRVVGLVMGSRITLAASGIGIVSSALLVAIGVLGWSVLAIALFSFCGMISSAIWKNAGR